MTIDLTGLVRPHLVEMTKREDNPNVAEFRLQPLERGFGYTLGNSLRRMLLSSLRGTAVWAFRLDGVVHEHQTVPGVLEDVHQIIQRLKALTLVLDPEVDEAVLHIKRDGAGPVYARDIQPHGSVRVVNPDQLLFTLQDDRDVDAELYVNKGRGYVESEMHPVDRSMPVDVVRIDAIYNPVRRANFIVAETRVGQRTDYDRLTVTVETNGTISPEDALAYCGRPRAGALPVLRRVRQGAGRARAGRRGLRGQPEPEEPAGPPHRRLRSLGALAQLAQEFEHPHARATWWSSARTICSRSRTSARRRSPKSASCCEREGLNFGLQFEDVDGELRVRSSPTVVGGSDGR